MSFYFVKKSNIGNSGAESLNVVLDGSHTMKQKACMFMQVKFLMQENGVPNAGAIHMYIPLLSADGYAVSRIIDPETHAEYNTKQDRLLIKSAYHCAAEHYRL